jgi:hypothetical protein
MLPLTHKETVNPLILRHLALEPLPAAA